MALEIEAVGFQFVDNIAHNADIIRRDEEGAVGDLLEFSLIGIGNTAQEVKEAARNFFVRLLQVDHDGTSVLEVIGDFGGIF